MPFTLSHPAAIIPFHYVAARNTSLSALVIGSMSPDFVYFLSFGISGRFSHSMSGIFLYCIPASLIVYLIFHFLMREPIVALMPEAISTRIQPQSLTRVPTTIVRLLLLISSICIGAATHIIWDAFTDANTVIVDNFEFLRATVGSAWGWEIPVYIILQHVSSILGLIILTRSISQWLRRTPQTITGHPRMTSRQKVMACAAILLAGLVGGVIGWKNAFPVTLEHAIFNIVVRAMTAMGFATLLFCTCWQIGMSKRKYNV